MKLKHLILIVFILCVILIDTSIECKKAAKKPIAKTQKGKKGSSE